ncbi:SRPBCC family protein [Luteolibacter flavescens]|uniref:SRPBCC family protein n=1 Tax=Luteolibacter flavescens TaxID=1859460 RepID=A0ABT3FTH8_9BACT|nr:SRPBCC family protein [Luteolibacter flavescens]MCW1886891.1 SRPBCC family protein [Luteolibacter flavescens]
MPRIELVFDIAAPIERVFDLARSIDVHQESQTRHGERAVAGRTSGLIEAGETVTWEATHFGIRQRLSSRIDSMTKPVHFRDSMISGAFADFVHDHHFEAIPGGTRMTDVFDYTAPLGLLGRLADVLFLARYMRRLLEERNEVIRSLAENESRLPKK